MPLLLQGIELKEAASNPLLGQFHLHNNQGFVKAKMQATSAHHETPEGLTAS